MIRLQSQQHQRRSGFGSRLGSGAGSQFGLPHSSRLFLRIFLWFWLAMTLAGSVLLALEAVRAEHLTQRWRGVTSDAFAFYATSAAKDHEDRSDAGAKEFLTDLNTRTGIRAWLFDAQGHEVSRHAPQALQVHASWRDKPMRQLMELSRQNQRTEFATLGQITLASHTTRAPSGASYYLVGELPAARFGPWEARPQIQALRLLAILAAAGLVSWLLSRQLVTPIESLRAATHRLASGDLTARTETELHSRHDELSQLAHDFDRMAERIESLLREQEHLVGVQRRLLRDVAHELRSPLARLIVALELTRDSLKTTATGSDSEAPTGALTDGVPLAAASPSTQASLDRIEREAGRLSEMIDRLLMLARLDSGVQSPEAALIDLAGLIQAVAADAEFEARPTRRVVSVTECDECTIKGTLDLLRSALENVMRNAVRYTPQDSSVDIYLRREGDWAIVTVRDHGPGVPENELSELFQPFYRATPVEGAEATAGQGSTGLGLAITERAIHLHGGTINATNATGGGLLVTIRLPLTDSYQ